MSHLKNRVYASRIISGTGDWMTFLATALWISTTYGADRVPYSFLAMSLPHLLFSRRLAHLVRNFAPIRVFAATQILLALNVFSLAFSTASLPRIYAYVLISSTLTALSRPLWDSLLGQWFSGDERREVFTRNGAITSALLIFAPALGGALSQWLGYRAVFVIDGASFLLGLALLVPELSRKSGTEKAAAPSPQTHSIDKNVVPELNWQPDLRATALAWYGILLMGALINGTEYLAFQQSAFTPAQIGLVTASWGIGGLASFLFSKRLQGTGWLTGGPLSLGASLGAFLLSDHWQLSAAFFALAGFLNAHIGGALRSRVSAQIPASTPPLQIWSVLNQRLSIINISIYALCGSALAQAHLIWSSGLILLAGVTSVAFLGRPARPIS